MKGIWMTAALALLCGAAAAAPPEAHLSTRTDRYSVAWGSISLGEGKIMLRPSGGNCYDYTSVTDPIALVRWTYGAPRESAHFCLRDGDIVARHFEYHNEKRSKDSFILDFDWSAGKVKTIVGGEMSWRELPETAYDRFVVREAVRLWVIDHQSSSAAAIADAGQITTEEVSEEEMPQKDFTIVDDDRIRTYRLAITGHERVETPAGSFDTIRVDRIDSNKRSFRYWLAAELDYIPVKLEHLKNDKVELRMLLLSSQQEAMQES